MGNYIYGVTPVDVNENKKITDILTEETLVNAKNKLKKTETIEKNVFYTDEEYEIIKIKKKLRNNNQYMNLLEEIKKTRQLKHVIISKQLSDRDNLLNEIKFNKNILKPSNTIKKSNVLDVIKNKKYKLNRILEDGRLCSINNSKNNDKISSIIKEAKNNLKKNEKNIKTATETI